MLSFQSHQLQVEVARVRSALPVQSYRRLFRRDRDHSDPHISTILLDHSCLTLIVGTRLKVKGEHWEGERRGEKKSEREPDFLFLSSVFPFLGLISLFLGFFFVFLRLFFLLPDQIRSSAGFKVKSST